MKTSFLNSVELIICFWNKGHTWNFLGQTEMHNFFESSLCGGSERLKEPKHPTQKPVKLLEHIIKIASNENDVVFDPFMGVGSTGVAALKLKRRFLGIELDDAYFVAAEKRINDVSKSLLSSKSKNAAEKQTPLKNTVINNTQGIRIASKINPVSAL